MTKAPATIDQYIATFPPDVQEILQRIRATIAKAVPKAQEKISYRIPAFALDRDVIYFAAFKKHIGVGIAFHVRVVVAEEPWLARTHGAAWDDYVCRVRRWL